MIRQYKMDLGKWTLYLTGILSKYFNKTYKVVPSDISRIINKRLYIVYRPNHGLLYALRQGFLAIDIINLLAKQGSNTLSSWVKYKIQTDPYFKIKVMFASSFQRSGRESEIGSSANPKLYNAYERTDAIYFQTEATKHIGTLFKDKHEVLIYKEAILWSTVDEGLLSEKSCQSLYFLRKILHTAHLLDLRRIPDFDIQQIKKNSMEILFENINLDHYEKISLIDQHPRM